MADIRSKIHEIYSLEQLAANKSVIHEIHPLAKIITTLVYIVCIVSFNRYDVTGMVPFVFYPAIIMALAEIPMAMIFKRTLVALPFCLFAGISNIIFDREIMMYIGTLPLTYGIVSCTAIVFRTILCVSGALILVSVIPFSQFAGQLRRMHVPGILVTMVEMIYRYIGVLLGEASTMYTAYKLRHHDNKGLEMKDMGTFTGQLLLRSFDRAERIYGAMQCRNFVSAEMNMPKKPLKISDYTYIIVVSGLCITCRIFNIQTIISSTIGGLF